MFWQLFRAVIYFPFIFIVSNSNLMLRRITALKRQTDEQSFPIDSFSNLVLSLFKRLETILYNQEAIHDMYLCKMCCLPTEIFERNLGKL